MKFLNNIDGASRVITDPTHRFVTDDEKSAWNSKANASHTHTKSQITDFPTSLPASGGNADTVDGKHASDFANSYHTHVPNQISVAGNTSGSLDMLTRQSIGSGRSNKSFCIPANAITIEYSRDGGTTWVDYGVTDDQKRALFAETRGINFYLGKCFDKTHTTDFQLRVTIEPLDRYVSFDTFYCWMCNSGNNTTVEIQASTIGAKTTFTTIGTPTGISGWSGNNVIYFSQRTFGGGETQTSNQYSYRMIFRMTSINSNYGSASISDIRFLGLNVWSSPNNMVAKDHIYSWDINQNTYFPNNIECSQMVSRIATGLPPFAVSSTTGVTNLNADLLDGKHASDFANASHTHNALSVNGGNECDIAYGFNFDDGNLYVNYRGAIKPITNYKMCNGQGFTLAEITASKFNGTATNSDMLSGFPLNTDGNVFGSIPLIKSDGGIEAGNYIDFHEVKNDSIDYSARLSCIGSGALAVSGNFRAKQLVSNIADGTPPIVVTSTTGVPNLNADTVDGKHASDFANASHTHTKSQISDFPTSLPANGGNSTTVNGHTVYSDVPANAKFTDTVYTLPMANGTTLGGVKSGGDVTLSSGLIELNRYGIRLADLRLQGDGLNYAGKLSFGDGDYAYIAEETDNALTMTASAISLKNGTTEVLKLQNGSAYYKGVEINSIPIGGASLGGVKNGGNVTINADGTMTAPSGSGGSNVPFYNDVGGDVNTIRSIGCYSGSFTNAPYGNYGSLLVQHSDGNVAAYVNQIWIPEGQNMDIWYRTTNNASSWGAWCKLAKTDSPAFTGTPTAPTASVGTNNTQIATTAFVLANAGGSINYGTYIGNGPNSVGSGYTSRTISLPKTPSFVFVCLQNGFSAMQSATFGGLALSGSNCMRDGVNAINIVSNGFEVHNNEPSNGSIAVNWNSYKYHYIWG